MPDDGRRGPHDLEAGVEELYEHAPCALLSTLGDGTVVRANETFFEWMGLSRQDVVGRTQFQSMLTIGARMYYETHYAPLLHMQGFVNEIALEVRRADGTTRPVVASARQVRGDDGSVVVNRVALFDSTDRRKYEKELLAARRQAEEAVNRLSDAGRRKNEFIAMLAHELRNPLAPVRNAVEILRRSDQSPTVDKIATMMGRQVGQMVRLVEDLLDISRLGQDRLTVRRVPVDLASVIQHAIESTEPLMESAGLTFTADIPAMAIYAEADAARLVQVVGNVLHNAAKFTPRGGRVSLGLEREQSDAVIRIRDSGVGIEPERLSSVFDKFTQGDISLERRDGLGIGLTLAKHLMERHGGQITVHSDGLGHGTEFVLRLPALAVPLESVAHSPRSPFSTPMTPRRVFIVDDNRDSAELLSMLLASFGHDIRTAHDGLEAVRVAAEFQPEVMLLDIGLPGMNGYEVARQIRAGLGTQPVLVALTGWGQEEDRRKSLAAGFNLHLVKPVDYDVLVRLLSELPQTGQP